MLIVDDEEQIRSGISKFVAGRYKQFESVETAGDGEEALRKVESQQPDIIISDVVMPVLNGIEFARESREKLKNVKIIMISGHDDFNFVRSSLLISAYDYILKPIDLEELHRVLTSVIARCEEERREEEERRQYERQIGESAVMLRERWLRSFVQGRAGSRERIVEMLGELGLTEGVGVPYDVLVCAANVEPDADLPEKTDESTAVLAAGLGDRMKASFAFPVDESAFVLLLPLPNDPAAQAAADRCEEAAEWLAANAAVPFTVGAGTVASDWFAVPGSYREAELAAAQRFLRSDASAFQFTDMPAAIDRSEPLSLPAETGLDCLSANEPDRLFGHLRAQFAAWESVPAISPKGIDGMKMELIGWLNQLVKLVNGKPGVQPVELQWEDLMRRRTLRSIEDWLRSTLVFYGERLREGNGNQHLKLLRKMKEIAEAEYRGAIGVQQIGDRLGYSPNYLSALFKQETGMNFTEYLTRLRLAQAKELMKVSSLRLYEIGSAVGYEDENYFSRVFLKYEGIRPSAYRERLG